MSSEPRRVHPWVFMVLCIPFGAVGGYATVTLPYQLKIAGVSVAKITALSAIVIMPQTWKFFWAPVVDVTLDQRKWYLISGLATVVGIAAFGFFPATAAGLTALSIVIFLASLASTFNGMACDSLVAYATPDELRGRAAGWYQAGNLGGAGIGGGLGLELAGRLPAPWMGSCIVGGLCLLCCAAVFLLPKPEAPFGEHKVLRKLGETAKDLWQMARQRAGALALILCFLPIGSGAAPFAAIATEWRASDHIVAIVTGVLGGVISAVGCIAGGWLCDRMDRKDAYVWFGIFQAAAGIAMALMPRTQFMYVLWTLIYTFGTGLAYAAFSAFTLEAIGKGAAATKYNALASLSNVPIYYMTVIDGAAHDKWNSTGMFFTESALAVAAAVIFMLLAKVLWRKRATATLPALQSTVE
jgi:MFS transporter, PAT family, beta-lactamase induction signal transducer AmpG